MNITVNEPGTMRVDQGKKVGDQVMVHVDVRGDRRALLLWIDPATAAQWVEALTPIAATA